MDDQQTLDHLIQSAERLQSLVDRLRKEIRDLSHDLKDFRQVLQLVKNSRVKP